VRYDDAVPVDDVGVARVAALPLRLAEVCRYILDRGPVDRLSPSLDTFLTCVSALSLLC
jgi:hypothetical protein